MSSGAYTLFGAVAGAAATVVIAVVRYYWLRPKLEISDDNPESGSISSHVVLVTNRGRSVARACQGMISLPNLGKESLLELSKIERIPAAYRQKYDVVGEQSFLLTKDGSFRSITNELTVWSRLGGPVDVDIHPGSSAMLNVCMVIECTAGYQVHFPSEKGWQCIRAATALDEPIAVRVRVVTGNGLGDECDLEIRRPPTRGT